MPKPQPTKHKPDENPEAEAARRLLSAMQDLDQLDKFTLAAVIVWIRTEWRGKSKVLNNTEQAMERIFALSVEESCAAVERAADDNLVAAVTS